MRTGAPLLDLRVLRHRTYRLSLILMSVAFMAMLGAMILLPLYLQEVRGLSPLETGLLVMPGGLAMGLLGPRVGALFDRFGSKPLVIPGSIGIVVSLFALTQIGADTPYALILGVHVLLMVSLAALFTPVFTLGLGDVPMHAVLPRQLDAGHHPAGRRRVRHRAGDHPDDQPRQRPPRRGRRRSRRPPSTACSWRSWSAP